MKNVDKKWTWLGAGLVSIAAAVGAGSHYFLGMPEDNLIEELAEDFIEDRTGLSFDITPGSKEK